MDELVFSLVPVLTAFLFLGFGLYILYRKGLTPISGSFFILCLTTFFWQCTWAVLFQVDDTDKGIFLARLGYLLIFFLPTSLYHFLTEITGREEERRWVYFSYALAGVFSILLLSTNLFVSGVYDYYWGFYPKAGVLHPLHILQTVIVVNRGLYITYRAMQTASPFHRIRLKYCLVSLLIYFFAAVDYLCNYGIEFYPPGVVFLGISLWIMTVAIVRYKLMDNPTVLAATIAQEMRTPLASINQQAKSVGAHWSDIVKGYELAVFHNLMDPTLTEQDLKQLRTVMSGISEEVARAQTMIDVVLATVHSSPSDSFQFHRVSMFECIQGMLERYPFEPGEAEKVHVEDGPDLYFWGSEDLMRYTLYNLLKNALYSIRQAGQGEVRIKVVHGPDWNSLIFSDTGGGIPKDVQPHIFDDFFSTKSEGSAAGIGLSFCRRVMKSFNGSIECHSALGEATQFVLHFPRFEDVAV